MKYLSYWIGCIFLVSCVAAPLKYEKAKELETNAEFDKAVKIEEASDGTAAKNQKQVPEVAPKATPSEYEKALAPEKKSIETPVKKNQKIKKIFSTRGPVAPSTRV